MNTKQIETITETVQPETAVNTDQAETLRLVMMDAIKARFSNGPKFTIMMLGKSGVGKSTLVNAVFGYETVKTGNGKPVTQDFQKIEIPDHPLVIYDTPGFELSGDHSTVKMVNEANSIIQKNQINLILYCINVGTHRIEQTEINLIKGIIGNTKDNKTPVIVVLTQAYASKDANELESVIRENIKTDNVISIIAEDKVFDENYTKKANGLSELLGKIKELIPQDAKKTLGVIQVIDPTLLTEETISIISEVADTEIDKDIISTITIGTIDKRKPIFNTIDKVVNGWVNTIKNQTVLQNVLMKAIKRFRELFFGKK